jgi:electron transfer flavoprotein alpha subunit
METDKNILIFGEIKGDRISPHTTQVMRIGLELSRHLGQEMHALFLGGRFQKSSEEAYAYGASWVYMASDPLLENYMTDSYLQAMEKVVRQLGPAIVLFGHNENTASLAPRLAFRLRTGVTLDCVDLKINDANGLLEQVKPVFGGKAHAHYCCGKVLPQIASVREGAFDSANYDGSRKGEVSECVLSLDRSRIRTRFLKKKEDESQAMALKLASAGVVVCGGRGLGGKEGVDLIKETADLLDGAIAGSRPAAENGWVPSSLQVGLTGKKVNPHFYIAVGISGALQHIAGCQKAKTIVAINSDETAPIFKLSHYGVVGDYKEVLKGFNREVKQIKE